MQENKRRLLKQLAKGIAAQFGENCEVALHELNEGDPERTIFAIENGQVTHRAQGDGASRVVLRAMRNRDGEAPDDQLGYLTRTDDGRVLKSTTLYIRDEAGRVEGVFSINYDISGLLALKSAIEPLIETHDEARKPERIVRGVNDLLDELIERSVELAGKPVALMNKEDKVRAIRFLNQAGAFLITKSGDKVSKYFGISKYTLYNYIDTKQEG